MNPFKPSRLLHPSSFFVVLGAFGFALRLSVAALGMWPNNQCATPVNLPCMPSSGAAPPSARVIVVILLSIMPM